MSVLIVPTSGLRRSIEGEERKKKSSKAGTPKKSARQDAALLDADAYDPRNFMVKGGTRAYEQKLTNLSRACIQDLRGANDVLATELLRHRHAHDEEREALRQEVAELSSELRLAQEGKKVALERLSEEGHARSCQEAAHNSRLREITKRLRDEHNARTAAETEVAQLKQQVVCLEEPARAAQDLRGSVARLEATLAGEQALIQDLRSRLALAESKLDTEAAAKAELQVRSRSAEAQAALLAERVSSLTAAVSEAEARTRSAQTRLEVAQEELLHSHRELSQERDAQAVLKAAAGKLQADLTELQAVSTLSSAHAAAGKTELERLRRECSELSQRDMANQEELDRLRESLLNARGEAAGYKASSEALASETHSLRDELSHLRSEAETAKHQLASASHQAEQHQQLAQDRDALQARLQRVEAALQQKEVILAETVANHASQLEMWRSEATEVATAASKWKQRALNLQQQLETLEKESSSATQDVRLLASRAGAAEADRARLADLCASLEVKLSAANQELTTLHTHLQDALSSQAAAVRKAEACTLEAAQSKEALGQLQSKLQEEGGRTLTLRQDLAALSQQQVRELDAKARMLSDLTSALQREERSRAAAQQEAAALRTHLHTLERELRTAQAALSSIHDDKLRTQDAYEAAEAALRSAQRRARHYKHESKV